MPRERYDTHIRTRDASRVLSLNDHCFLRPATFVSRCLGYEFICFDFFLFSELFSEDGRNSLFLGLLPFRYHCLLLFRAEDMGYRGGVPLFFSASCLLGLVGFLTISTPRLSAFFIFLFF